MNIGEEIVAAYLQFIKGCEFIQKNLYTPDVQGEIDVVGIDINKKELYVCEVAVHLITGLQYVKDNQPNNVRKLFDKFSKDIEYSNKYFVDYKKHFMFWSPVVKNQSKESKHNQLRDIEDLKEEVMQKYGVEIEAIINDKFLNCLTELRNYAKERTEEIKSPILRLFQVEEYTIKHVNKSIQIK